MWSFLMVGIVIKVVVVFVIGECLVVLNLLVDGFGKVGVSYVFDDLWDVGKEFSVIFRN